MDVARQSRTHEEVLSAEMQAKEEMRLALERSNLETRQRQDSLIIQVSSWFSFKKNVSLLNMYT